LLPPYDSSRYDSKLVVKPLQVSIKIEEYFQQEDCNIHSNEGVRDHRENPGRAKISHREHGPYLPVPI
jgi:hypothetical protein